MSQQLHRDNVLWALAMHRGEAAGVRAQDLVREICGESNARLERELRHVIEALRKDGHHVCGHPSSGYFIAATEEELTRTLQYLYHRAMTTLSQICAMRKVALPDLRGQLRLPS